MGSNHFEKKYQKIPIKIGVSIAIAIGSFCSGMGRLGPLGPGPLRNNKNEENKTNGNGNVHANFDWCFWVLFSKQLGPIYCRELEFHVPPAPYRRQKKGCAGYGGGGAEPFFFISKNLPLKGKFFEMVSWRGLGGFAPLRNLRYPCLAPGGSGGRSPP